MSPCRRSRGASELTVPGDARAPSGEGDRPPGVSFAVVELPLSSPPASAAPAAFMLVVRPAIPATPTDTTAITAASPRKRPNMVAGLGDQYWLLVKRAPR